MENRFWVLCLVLGSFAVMIFEEGAVGEALWYQRNLAYGSEIEARDADTNRDGKISAEEFSRIRMIRFQSADKDQDDRLSLSELREANPGAGWKRAQRRFNQMDVNQDGSVSAEEFQETDARIFSRIDADGNGFITSEEVSAIGSGRAPDPFHDYLRHVLER